METERYTKKVLMRMQRVELLAIAEVERVNLGKLKRLTKRTISDEIIRQIASRPFTVFGSIANQRGVKGLIGPTPFVPNSQASVRVKRLRAQNRG